MGTDITAWWVRFRSVLGNLYHTAGEDSKISIWTRACCSKWSGWCFAHQLVVSLEICVYRLYHQAEVQNKGFVNFEICPFLGIGDPNFAYSSWTEKCQKPPWLLNTLGLEVFCTPKTYKQNTVRLRRYDWKTRYWTLEGVGIWVSYCWWKKSCTTWDERNLVNNGILSLSTGAGFLPSTVGVSWSTHDKWIFS